MRVSRTRACLDHYVLWQDEVPWWGRLRFPSITAFSSAMNVIQGIVHLSKNIVLHYHFPLLLPLPSDRRDKFSHKRGKWMHFQHRHAFQIGSVLSLMHTTLFLKQRHSTNCEVFAFDYTAEGWNIKHEPGFQNMVAVAWLKMCSSAALWAGNDPVVTAWSLVLANLRNFSE